MSVNVPSDVNFVSFSVSVKWLPKILYVYIVKNHAGSRKSADWKHFVAGTYIGTQAARTAKILGTPSKKSKKAHRMDHLVQ